VKPAALMLVLAGGVSNEPLLLERGGLALRLPAGWHETAPPKSERGALTVTLGPEHGEGYQLLLSVVTARTASIDTRVLVERAGRQALKDARETTLAVRELRGDRVSGHYFELTDREPGAGEYEGLVQGIVTYGPLQVSFTLLLHPADAATREAALDLLRRARPAGAADH